MEAPGYWDNPEKAQQGMIILKGLKDEVETYEGLTTSYEDIETLLEMGYEEADESLIPEVQAEMDDFVQRFENLRIKTLLSGEYDKDNAILKLNAGAGGTESCDWASMLYRMYTRWAEKKGFSVEVLDYLDGDEAGIKSVTFQINGENAYGYLKSEKVSIDWFEFLLSMHRGNVRHLSYPWMLCRILKMISILKSIQKI